MQVRDTLTEAKHLLRQAIDLTDRGKKGSPEGILTQIAELEALTPTPEPTRATALLSGNWRMIYTTSRDLINLGTSLPGVTTGEIYQCVRAEQGKVFNVAEIEGQGWLKRIVPSGIIAVAASFRVVSEKRVEVAFDSVVLGPQWVMNYEISCFLTLLEYKPKQLAAIRIPLPPQDRKGWLDITYLDPELRIGRGNQGSLFVLEKVHES
jgi:hypothetical protein